MKAETRVAPLEEQKLQLFEFSVLSPIWEAYKPAFEHMFEDTDAYKRMGMEKNSDTIFFEHNGKSNWDWYIKERLLAKPTQPHAIEDKLYDELFKPNNNARLVYIIGHTGIGKTTLIYYFFNEYLPNIKKINEQEMKKIVPFKLPLHFAPKEDIRVEWDKKVHDFLYNRFEELLTDNFIKNVARHILYPTSNVRLNMNADGVLIATAVNDHYNNFIKNTEDKIENTYTGCDKISAYNWLCKDIMVAGETKRKDIGNDFNKYVIQVLSKYYGYRFFLIIDNIDHLSSTLQTDISTIVTSKMRLYAGYNNVSFILALRENTYEPIYTETNIPAFAGAMKFIHIPPLQFSKVLKSRKMYLFDPLIPKCSQTIVLKNDIKFKPQSGSIDVFMSNVFRQYDNYEFFGEFCKIANYNVRSMLCLVKTVFMSPVSTDILFEIISPGKYDITKKYISINRMIDILVRCTNHIYAQLGAAILPNMYKADESENNHYSATLCRAFILKMVNNEQDGISYNVMKKQLEVLGHPSAVIKNATNDLLKMNAIFSNMGFTIEDDDRNKLIKLEKKGLPYGEYLLNNISTTLSYLQNIAYITPLESTYRSYVVVPDNIESDLKDFKMRLKCASGIYQQIRADMKRQIKFITKKTKKQYIFDRYNFSSILTNIREGVMKDITHIGASENDELKKVVKLLNIDEMFPE